MTPWESGLIRAAVLVWALAFLTVTRAQAVQLQAQKKGSSPGW